MPDIDEILEILQRNVDDARDRMSQILEGRMPYLLEEEGLADLPHRFYDQLVAYLSALHNAVTAGGTLPALPLPGLGLGSYEKKAPPPPPVPPTYWESLIKHVKARPYTYSLLGGVTFTAFGTIIAVHVSPTFRARLFSAAPLLEPIYIKRRRGLPPTPRPRVSSDGKHRLEAVLVLGCEPGSYGREVAKAFERQGFIVIASVSSPSEVDELEFCGKGYIKALVLDPNASPFTSIQPFVRSLNTALSLRYPLRSAGDPFHYISSSVPGIQLISVINCLTLTKNDYPALPIEALPLDAFSGALESNVVLPISLLQSLLPLLRVSHDPQGLPATVITCLRAPDRFLGTPFTGSTSAVPGIASNALASALDVLRRELNLVESRSRRKIKLVNVDVGFLQPVNTKKSHRGVSHSPESRNPETNSFSVERHLPAHLRDMYAPALLANYDARTHSARHRMPDAGVLTEKLLKIVLAKRASHIPDRVSVGVGVRSYYIASLLPTSLIDMFFSFRQRLVTGVATPIQQRNGESFSAVNDNTSDRRSLPLPGQASYPAKHAAESINEESYSVDNEETMLPPYASFPDGSSAMPSQAQSPVDIHSSVYSESTGPPSTPGSRSLGESYIRV